MPKQLTDEQVTDINARVEQAMKFLADLALMPAAQISIANMGENKFCNEVAPYLQDLKYSQKPAETPVEVVTDPEVIPAAE